MIFAHVCHEDNSKEKLQSILRTHHKSVIHFHFPAIFNIYIGTWQWLSQHFILVGVNNGVKQGRKIMHQGLIHEALSNTIRIMFHPYIKYI